jgi:ankyrin repeat protein
MFAARNGYSDICRALLDAGAALNKKTKKGETALMMAVETGRVHTVSLLIERGATTHDMTEDGVTPLMIACAYMKNDDRFREIAKIISKTLANVFTTKVCVLRFLLGTIGL